MRFFLSLIAAVCLFVSTARAEDKFRPSRVRLLMHASRPVKDYGEFRAHFIPAGNLIGDNSPHLYLGYGWKPVGWLDVEPVAGWDFGQDEPIASVRLTPSYGRFYGWVDGEIQFPSHAGYGFVQVDYKFLPWLHTGAEAESWGDSDDGSTWSHGGGPNLLFRLGAKAGVDLAIHIRKQDDSVKPEFVTRFHLFL